MTTASRRVGRGDGERPRRIARARRQAEPGRGPTSSRSTDRPGLVAAVCDGHGGDRYVRSDVGSRLGVEVACERRLDACWSQLGAQPTARAVEAHLAGAGRHGDRRAAGGHGCSTDVERRAVHRRRTGPRRVHRSTTTRSISYGCTLLLAVLSPSWVGLLQIGDGDVNGRTRRRTPSHRCRATIVWSGARRRRCACPRQSPTPACAAARPAAARRRHPHQRRVRQLVRQPRWRTDAGARPARPRPTDRPRRRRGPPARLARRLGDAAGDDVSMALLHRSVAVEGRATVVGRGGARAAGPRHRRPGVGSSSQRRDRRRSRSSRVSLWLGTCSARAGRFDDQCGSCADHGIVVADHYAQFDEHADLRSADLGFASGFPRFPRPTRHRRRRWHSIRTSTSSGSTVLPRVWCSPSTRTRSTRRFD